MDTSLFYMKSSYKGYIALNLNTSLRFLKQRFKKNLLRIVLVKCTALAYDGYIVDSY